MIVTYHIVHLETSLDEPCEALHVGQGVDTLHAHSLEPETSTAISEVFAERHKVDNLFAGWVLEHSLCLACNAVWHVEVSHHHAGLVAGEPEDARLDIVGRLVR